MEMEKGHPGGYLWLLGYGNGMRKICIICVDGKGSSQQSQTQSLTNTAMGRRIKKATWGRILQYHECEDDTNHACSCVLNQLSHVQLFAALWTVARQAPLSNEILQPRILEWLACPPPGDLLNSEIIPMSLMSPKLAAGFFTTRTTWEAHKSCINQFKCSNNIIALRTVTF